MILIQTKLDLSHNPIALQFIANMRLRFTKEQNKKKKTFSEKYPDVLLTVTHAVQSLGVDAVEKNFGLML